MYELRADRFKCGEGVPERTKGYFTSHLAAVSKILHVCYSNLSIFLKLTII
jgi:hypothetical protein